MPGPAITFAPFAAEGTAIRFRLLHCLCPLENPEMQFTILAPGGPCARLTAMSEASSVVREDVLRDPHYPVHKIADRLLPYLRVLADKFHPQSVILFGSYAYGTPALDSDIDFLIVKELQQSPLRERVRIRQAWWEMPRSETLLPFDLIVVSPERHRERLAKSAGFYDQIIARGIRLI